ncbi:mitotic spindle checkpoint protein (Mad2B), putative [Talaromyces stipitatus ATCC 10500]|uniref:Mitotic spindle checkpoint protein (Mad2B), putative n=1 Tax=Talaromyces stipitatus (strain ATCC 10500 / CBS 375.48 / QM 6759 / NRRL 1006) TaxID=441959 RepID=B8MBP9_TALSN|nr:mitotic spindle checkpoint protein (Mad2B), putative [Talaromyces stipitatus ATCC 10500]EED18182.1 mitotic spindle checkpoint protein (Mad2B), putative [Talaromyces stipitatus ATCC 10500]
MAMASESSTAVNTVNTISTMNTLNTMATGTATAPISTSKNVPNTQAAIAASFTNFLGVAMHQILFLRSVYPRATFLPVRAYNYPVRQSRHPKVCDYISDVALAVESEILKGTITAVTPMERYAFDLSGFPHVPVGEIYTTFEERNKEEATRPPSTAQTIDLEAQFRACLARLASACARLTPLPRDDEFGFTVCIEVREDALPPAGTTKEEQTWIVAEPGQVHVRSCTAPFSVSKLGSHSQQPAIPKINGRAKTVPVRRVEAGELRLELWVEEARQKFDERLL